MEFFLQKCNMYDYLNILSVVFWKLLPAEFMPAQDSLWFVSVEV